MKSVDVKKSLAAIAIIVPLVSCAMVAKAQTTASTVSSDNQDNQTVLDDGFVASARGSAMAGALSLFAEHLDAAYYNPALITLQKKANKKDGFLKQFHFPYMSAAINENALSLYKEMNKSGGAKDPQIGQAVIDAHAGERQYARSSLALDFSYNSLIVVPFFDSQLAAVPLGQQSDLVELHYQEQTGIGVGAAISNGSFSLGVFSYYSTLKDIQGDYLYLDMIDPTTRRQHIKDSTNNYAGHGVNVGSHLKLGKKDQLLFAISARDLGNTQFKKTSGDSTTEELTRQENLTMAVGLNPKFSKWGELNFSLEMNKLTHNEVHLDEKWQTGLEFNFWGEGSKAILSLRSGYSKAGASYGGQIKMGLITLQYASYPQDIGFGNKQLIERRQAAVFAVDLAD